MKTMSIVVLCFAAFGMTGCAAIQKALEVAERTEAQMNAAKEELAGIKNAVDSARKAYDDALGSGDAGKVGAALAALKDVESKYSDGRIKFDETVKAAELAAKELKDAKSTNDYLGTILGLIGGVFGGGGLGGFLGVKRGKKAAAKA